MRIVKLAPVVLAAAALVAAQNKTTAGTDLESIFNSGLAASLLAADTVPVSLTVSQSLEDFGKFSTFAAGSWLEIKGTGLATTTRQWLGSDFSGVNAPTSLDGVRVSINNKDAFVYYISPTQIDVQAPADTATGPVAIRVTNPSGQSGTMNMQKVPLAPGLLAPAKFNVNGKLYLAALYQDGATFVGNAGLVPGANFRPAKPGDQITTYGVGFGDVTPAVAPGVTVTQQNTLVNSFSLKFDQTEANVSYKGLAPQAIGLYQFNFTVPDVPAGDHQINVTLGGQAVAQTLYLTTTR
jgi:uncharacterized protein (TIGR03437 family)